MNKRLSTLIEISNIIRNIMKKRFKMKLILNFNGDGSFTFTSELDQNATNETLNVTE